jgi:hypothetical protein
MRTHTALTALAAVLATACGEDVTEPVIPPPPPLPLYYLKAPTNSGDWQTDTVLATLANPFRILVRRGDTPAPGITVRWQTPSDTVTGLIGITVSTLTDSQGIAAFRLTFGPEAAVYPVRATIPGVFTPSVLFIATDAPCGSGVCFTAIATPARPRQLRYASGNHQTGPINTPLGADYVVRVTDAYGNGIVGAVVDWTVTTGGGSITPTSATTTDQNGYARARHTLGPSGGPQSVTATANALPGAPQATFTATAVDLGPVADINGIWDWTEQYTNPVCADTGSYVFAQTGSAFSGSSQQVGVCVTSSGQIDNTHGPESVSNGIVVGDTITFLVSASCIYHATVSGNARDSLSGTTQCGSHSGTWQAVRAKPVASVTVAPANPTLVAGDTLRLAAQLRDADGFRLFFRPVTWSSDNPDVASVSPAGLVLAVSAGSATITASTGGQSGSAPVVVQ